MQKDSCNSLKNGTHGDLADEVKQYLEVSDNSSGLLKFLSDAIEENPLSPDRGSPVPDFLNKSSSIDGRAPSPASISSVTSNRRLEWDSGADVGYQQSNVVHPSLLSTLERMALDGCTESLIRTDPEGTNSCISSKRNPLLKSVVSTDLPVISNVKRASTTVSSPREVSGVINLSVFANNEAVSLRAGGKISPEGGSRKISVSVTGAGDATNVSASLNVPGGKAGGSHSLDRPRVVESPVDDNIVSEKNIQPAPLSSTVAANSASSSSLASTIVPHDASDALPSQSDMATTVEKVVTRGIQVGGTLKKCAWSSEASSVKNFSGSDDNMKVLTSTGCLPNLSKGRKNSRKTGRESLETSSFDYAQSFEYFPGEVFDKDSSRKNMMGFGKVSGNQPERINTSLSKDLERNIGQIREILSHKKASNTERKALIKSLVARIIGTDYLDDDEKNSDKSSVMIKNPSLIEKEHTSSSKVESQENVDVVSEKSFVPYRPVPGGRVYHVASQAKAKKGGGSSSSCCESDDSKPMMCYLPVDRVKITQQSSLSSERGSSSPICAKCLEKRNSELKQSSRAGKVANQKSCGRAFVEESKYDVEGNKPCCSRECHPRRNWWSPVTKSEKKHIAGNVKNCHNPVLTYVEYEKANQLHWIKNEIKHLTNLAQLLEDCSIAKSDSPTSLEEQMSLLSSINKKSVKNMTNTSDKILSSTRSTPVEEPITANMRWRSGLPKKKPVMPISPPSRDTSEEMHFSERQDNNSGTHSESQLYPSRSSSRNLTNSDINDQSKVYGRKHGNKDSEAYVITFEAGTPDKGGQSPKHATRKPLKEVRLKIPAKPGRNDREAFDLHCWTSLQEQLEIHHPYFIKSSLERQKCLEELARLRSLRQMTRRKLLRYTMSTWEDQLNSKQSDLKQKTLKPKPILSESMRKPTCKVKENDKQPCPRLKRRHRVLPEAHKKEAERIKKQSLQTNRIMADIFSRRLQKKVLSGAVSLSNSVSIISSL